MELTYTDAALRDVGLLDYTDADFAWGTTDNDFVITLSPTSGVPSKKSFIYNENGDLGGIVRSLSVDKDGAISISGATWTGMLAEKVLCPPSGQAYFKVGPCDASDAARQLIARLGLSSRFHVEGISGVTITHTFDGSRNAVQNDTGRYMDGWAALWQLVFEHGLNVSFRWNATTRKVIVEVNSATDRTDDESLLADGNSVSFASGEAVNHLICLGSGELAQRTVVHLFRDARGNISRTQTLFGDDEIADVYDDSGADDAAQLEAHGRAKLVELANNANSVTVETENDGYSIGDIIGGVEPQTGIGASAVITSKIVKYDGCIRSVTYDTFII